MIIINIREYGLNSASCETVNVSLQVPDYLIACLIQSSLELT